MPTIVVYGGELPAVCAAAKAAATSASATIHVIVPYVTAKLGGIATVGGQNYWDTSNGETNPANFPQQGTFPWLYQSGSGYNTDEMADKLEGALTKYGSRMVIHYGYDVCDYTTVTSPNYQIKSVTIRKLSYDSNKRVIWGSTSTRSTIPADIFIDASVEGRLARKINSACTTGRYDWPSNYRSETVVSKAAKQQAATLMLKLTGINRQASTAGKSFGYSYDSRSKAYTCWGGSIQYKDKSSALAKFNEKYDGQGYMLKPVNAAQNGANSNEWWINSFLIYNVDGRAHHRDKGTAFYPSMVSGTKNVDDAWVDARAFLKNHASEVLAALREFPGFESANFVYDSSGYPVVGDVLYIRETVHMAIQSTYSGSNAENANYQVGTLEALRAGTGSGNGSDKANYSHRIGLAHYGADIYPYSPEDCKNSSGEWIWNYDGYRKMRPDLNIQDNAPTNPVYLPYEALITTYVSNLLLPGYAANVSSFAWGEIRVLPNLCVLGDAAGVAAGYCVNNGYLPRYLNDSQIQAVQNLLKSVDAKIDK